MDPIRYFCIETKFCQIQRRGGALQFPIDCRSVVYVACPLPILLFNRQAGRMLLPVALWSRVFPKAHSASKVMIRSSMRAYNFIAPSQKYNIRHFREKNPSPPTFSTKKCSRFPNFRNCTFFCPQVPDGKFLGCIHPCWTLPALLRSQTVFFWFS